MMATLALSSGVRSRVSGLSNFRLLLTACLLRARHRRALAARTAAAEPSVRRTQ
jgi:hypothetical protein